MNELKEYFKKYDILKQVINFKKEISTKSKWKKYKSNNQVKAAIESIEEAGLALDSKLDDIISSEGNSYDYMQFNKHILPLIVAYPDTKFILFFVKQG